MPNQYLVPQFIEVESKIIGPISGRQFVIMLIAFGLSYVTFMIFQSPYIFIPGIIFFIGIGIALAFFKINGQSMHYVLLNLTQTLKRPRLKIWKREYVKDKKSKNDDDLPPVYIPVKPRVSESHLTEMSLMVDTGGIYQGEVPTTE